MNSFRFSIPIPPNMAEPIKAKHWKCKPIARRMTVTRIYAPKGVELTANGKRIDEGDEISDGDKLASRWTRTRADARPRRSTRSEG